MPKRDWFWTHCKAFKKSTINSRAQGGTEGEDRERHAQMIASERYCKQARKLEEKKARENKTDKHGYLVPRCHWDKGHLVLLPWERQHYHFSLTAARHYNLPTLTPPTLESHNYNNNSSISWEWEWYLVCVTVSPCVSIYYIVCVWKVKNNSVSSTYWGPSSISISHAPLPGIKDCKKKKKKKPYTPL